MVAVSRTTPNATPATDHEQPKRVDDAPAPLDVGGVDVGGDAEPEATFGRVNIDRGDFTAAPDDVNTDARLTELLDDSVRRAQLTTGDLDRRRIAERGQSVPGKENPKADLRTKPAAQRRGLVDGTPLAAADAAAEADATPMPEPRDSHPNAPTAPAEGDLIVDGVEETDVEQGAIADCYFASSMAAVAQDHPELIEDAITDNGDGTYRVRFFNDDGDPEYVTVDDELYRNDSGGILYARGTDRSELWPAILEKGYAQWRGGYDDIGEGGNSGDALRALTGRGVTYTAANGDTDALYDTLRAGADGDHPMVAGTYGEEKEKKYTDSGISTWHAYTVLDASEGEDGQRYVTLRNPWGSTEFNADYETDVDWDGDGTLDGDDGIFRMTIEDFQRYYQGVHVGR